MFYAALNDSGRAGFVMANSAGDARGSEMEIRRQLIESGGVDIIVSVAPKFFYTVTLPCTLWFLDRKKEETVRADQVLFIEARWIFRHVDAAHRDFQPEQIEFLANIARLHRGEEVELIAGSADLLAVHGLSEGYVDVPGLCKVATREEIEAQGWSLTPGRYVGAAARDTEDVDFAVRLEELAEELVQLNGEAVALEDTIADNVALVLEAAR
jgi:type I restriction enzyme M protein